MFSYRQQLKDVQITFWLRREPYSKSSQYNLEKIISSIVLTRIKGMVHPKMKICLSSCHSKPLTFLKVNVVWSQHLEERLIFDINIQFIEGLFRCL